VTAVTLIHARSSGRGWRWWVGAASRIAAGDTEKTPLPIIEPAMSMVAENNPT
jgi:hypothetical protein